MDPNQQALSGADRTSNANRDKRVVFFEQLVRSGKADSFAYYALALEYQRLNRTQEAVAAFESLRARDPNYLPMYLMAGRLLSREKQEEQARDWLEAGIALARTRGDTKAFGELSEALAELT